MNRLFDQEIKKDDKIYSESMGWGVVLSVSERSMSVRHSGQNWRYNSLLKRQGCKISDISWIPKPSGLQIKNKESGEKAALVLNELSQSLSKHYG